MAKKVSCWWRFFFAHFSGIGGIIGINGVPKLHSKMRRWRGLNQKHGKMFFLNTVPALKKNSNSEPRLLYTTRSLTEFPKIIVWKMYLRIQISEILGTYLAKLRYFPNLDFPSSIWATEKKPGRILSINYCLEPKQNFWKGIGRWSRVIHNRNKGSQSYRWFEPPLEK